MHTNIAVALEAVRAAIRAVQEGADNAALFDLREAEAKLAEIAADPGAYACVAFREIVIAAPGNLKLRRFLVGAVSFLPLAVRARNAEGGELVEVPVDIGAKWREVVLDETRVQLAVVLRYPDAMQVASLAGDVSDLA